MSRRTKKPTGSLIDQDQGITSTEYAIIGAVVAVVLVAAFGLVGTELTQSYSNLANTMRSE